MFKITHTKVTHETIHLDKAQSRELTIKYLKSLISPGEYLREKDGVLCLYQDDPYHRHGSISEEFVRVATPLDIDIVNLLNKL